jgi:anti-sigma regulatory factor (Ser/Thr protein kinase)
MFVPDLVPAAESPREGTNAEVVAIKRLVEALADQARLGDDYARWAGTSAEQSAGVRLKAATLHVSQCDAAVKSFTAKVVPHANIPIRARRHVSIALGNALAFSVDGGTRAAGDARTEMSARLGPKLEPDVMDLAQLLLSELINNCVVHGAAAAPGTWIDVSASIFPQAFRAEVSDGAPAFRHIPGRPPTDEGSGRGLYLVEQLSSRWGISERGRSRVWFELARVT